MKIKYLILLLSINTVRATVSENECIQVFKINYEKLRKSTNSARAFLYSLESGFDYYQGYENCVNILRNGSSLLSQSIMAESHLTTDINNGIPIDPIDLERYLTLYPPLRSTTQSITESNSQVPKTNKEDCIYVNHSDKMQENRDQTDVGWCYAHAAADVLSFNIGEKVSSIDLAIQFNMLKNQDRSGKGKEALDLSILDDCDPTTERCFNEGGAGYYAVALAKANGVCKETALPSSSRMSREYGEILIKLEELDKFIGTTSSEIDTEALASEICSGEIGSFIRDAFPLALVSDVVDILNSDEMTNSFANLAMKSCKGKRLKTSDTMMYARVKNEGVHKSLGLIHQQLSNNNIAGIGYDSTLFASIENEVIGGSHESTVIGRRWNEKSKSCQLLIRNTIGDSCDVYHKYLECTKGNFWTDEADLMKNLEQVYYLE